MMTGVRPSSRRNQTQQVQVRIWFNGVDDVFHLGIFGDVTLTNKLYLINQCADILENMGEHSLINVPYWNPRGGRPPNLPGIYREALGPAHLPEKTI